MTTSTRPRATQPRRINVTGNVAAGKSTIARALGDAAGLPVIHLDHFVWLPGWKRRDETDKLERIEQAAAGDEWIIDGVSAHVRERTTAVVFIDLPKRVVLWRALRRIARLRMSGRPELGPGYPELRAWRPALRLAWRFNRHVRPGIEHDLEGVDVVVRLTSPREVEAMRDALRAMLQGAPGA